MEIEILDEAEKTGNMTRILPRKNELIRPAVANIDQALVIFALENPTPNLTLLDRFLVMMEQQMCIRDSITAFRRRQSRITGHFTRKKWTTAV